MSNPALFWGLLGSLIFVLVLTATILLLMWLHYFKIKKQVQEGIYLSKKEKEVLIARGINILDKDEIINYKKEMMKEQVFNHQLNPFSIKETKLEITENGDLNNLDIIDIEEKFDEKK